MLLYAITDRTMLDGRAGPQDGGARAQDEDERLRRKRLVELARAWAQGGVDFIQVREKDLGAEALFSLTCAIVEAVRAVPGSCTRVLLNAGAHVSTDQLRAACRGCGGDGLHLPGGSGRARAAWAAQPGELLSVACHSAEDVRAAREEGANLAVFAPVFEKPLGPGALPGVGLYALAEACRAAGTMPVIALGGVTVRNAAACLQAGAAGVAGIRLFLDGPQGEGAGVLPGWRALRRGICRGGSADDFSTA
jgi:thiamine-phosphate pyrophosphorylase